MNEDGSDATLCFFFFQAEDGIRDYKVTGVQTCALPISVAPGLREWREQVVPADLTVVDHVDAGVGELADRPLRRLVERRSESRVIELPEIGRASCRERV